MGICDGRIVIVTGAGRGIGRAHALLFAAEGAKVVVNDLGSSLDGTATGDTPADEVVAEIRAAGGEAIANTDDVADVDGAAHLVRAAIDAFGGLDVLVNNAGIIRDKMLINIDPDEFDQIVRVHLKGHFLTMKFAGTYWREQSKAGAAVDARIINTASAAGLFGNIGQAHYSAAKAGIAAMTRVAAVEMVRYGVTVNALAPTARTRMTETVMQYVGEKPEDGFDPQAPENVAPLVVWLGSAASREVTGQVFRIGGGLLGVAESWQRGPTHTFTAPFTPADAGAEVLRLIPQLSADIPKVIGAR